MGRHPTRGNSIEAFAYSGVSKTLTDSMRRTAMDFGLTYRAPADGQVDPIAGDSTNGLIAALQLHKLQDDHN
jgi:glycine betaine/choline ABC-type transport system substrate-binding protein